MTAVFPTLPGLGWSVSKAPKFATRTQKAISGRELRVADQALPIWTFTLTYEILRDAHDTRGGAGIGLGIGYDELRTLAGFFLQQQGAFAAFLFDDPSDDSVTGQYLATGDGSTTLFQLYRTFGGFTEPVIAPNVVGAIYFNGVAQSSSGYSVNAANGLVTFTAAPGAGVSVTADFTYYFLVRFADDTAEFENFMYQLWSLKQIKLQSVLL
jgi:uncharacterized protein (TIGR02217 family)